MFPYGSEALSLISSGVNWWIPPGAERTEPIGFCRYALLDGSTADEAHVRR